VKEQFKALITDKAGRNITLPVIKVSGKWKTENTTYPKGSYECKIYPYFSESKYIRSTHKISFIETGSKKEFLSGFLTVCYTVDTKPFFTFWFRPYESDRKNPFKIISRYPYEICNSLVEAIYFRPLDMKVCSPMYTEDRITFYSVTLISVEKTYENLTTEGSECKILEFIRKYSPSDGRVSTVEPGEYKFDIVAFMPKYHGDLKLELIKRVTLQRYTVKARIDRHTLVRI